MQIRQSAFSDSKKMQLSSKLEKRIVLLLSMILVICAMYFEPVTVSYAFDTSTASSFGSNNFTIDNVESEPEILTDRSEQIVTNSIRGNASRRSSGKGYESVDDFVDSVSEWVSWIFLSPAVSTRFEFGADMLFKYMMSFIWSQIGL